MAQPVIGIAASHSTLMNIEPPPGTEPAPGSVEFREGLAEARRRVVEARPDVILVVGSNHFRGVYLDLVPTFLIGVGELIASGDGGTPEGPLPTHVPLAQHLLSSLSADAFDMAFSARLQVDHGITHALQYLAPDLSVPVVPLIVNVFAPPLPSPLRCHELGRALRRALATFPEDLRVAVFASGGLSHELPFPDWRAPRGEDDEFMVEAWLEGRTDWQKYTKRRREIVLKASARVNPEFDGAFLDELRQGAVPTFVRLSSDEINRLAGNGGQEIRTWVTVASAMGNAPADVLVYEPIEEWMTGMGAVAFPA